MSENEPLPTDAATAFQIELGNFINRFCDNWPDMSLVEMVGDLELQKHYCANFATQDEGEDEIEVQIQNEESSGIEVDDFSEAIDQSLAEVQKALDVPTGIQEDDHHSILSLLNHLTQENTGWKRFFKRWKISDEPLRHDARNLLERINNRGVIRMTADITLEDE